MQQRLEPRDEQNLGDPVVIPRLGQIDLGARARRPPSIPALAPQRSSVLTKSQIERRAVAQRIMDENRGSAAMRRVLFFERGPSG